MDGTEFRARDELQKQEEQPSLAPGEEQAPSPSVTAESDVPAPLPETPDPAEPVGQPLVHKKKKLVLLIILAAALVVLGVAFFVWKDQIVSLFVKQPVGQTQVNAQTSGLSAIEAQKANDPELAKFISPTSGETWLKTPKDMPAQGWLKAELLSSYEDVGTGTKYYKSAKDQLAEAMPTYKEVGARGASTIVLVNSPSEGLGGMDYLFEKRQDGTVATIVKPQADGYSDPGALETITSAVTAKVTVFDQSTHYDSLNVPSKIMLKNGEAVLRPTYLWITDSFNVASGAGTKATLVDTLGGSLLYKTEVTYADTGLTNIGYYIQLPIGTKVSLRYEPNQPSLEGYSFDTSTSLQYTGSDGKLVYDELKAIARGCGGNSAAVTRSETLKDADLVQVGKSNTGRAVYEIKDANAALYQKAYSEYSETYGAESSVVSFDTYRKNHGLVIIKDQDGERLVYVRGQYAPAGGCAKPVVYLYPTLPTLVNVKVGANVTVSDPFYTSDGWKNVLAAPSGQLSYQGKQYDSLFWEGTGYGMYPGISSGTVVKRADAAVTMRRQLAEQGLNAKEASDFMAFWESKIPNKPYVRLTWFNTAQMNVLAPLMVSPKPDTTIRVFLDMDGFDSPLSLPAQKLSAVPRFGFTVVEWGGLTSEIRH